MLNKTPKFISVADWAALSGDSMNAVRRQIYSGSLRYVKEGRRVQIDYGAAPRRKHNLPSAATVRSQAVNR